MASAAHSGSAPTTKTSIEVDAELWKKFRAATIEDGVTARSVLEAAISSYLDNREN